MRKLSLPFEEINDKLKDSVCLVTGGLGCVGSQLVQELLRFDVRSIIIYDIAQAENSGSDRITVVRGDVRDMSSLMKTMDAYKPQFVFHTAAQRNPGLAELHIGETVTTNVLGTLNVANACELSGTVKQCIFTSTGKSSRYLTEEIYAGTKKMCEFIMSTMAKRGKVKYGMVRFTHILDNSLMDIQLRNECENSDFVAVHCPGKFVTAQNVEEAAYLLLNALIYSEDNECNFLLVRNLAWPVESLEMALYYTKESGRTIPVIFMGNPVGYTEKFFRGQMDWANPLELNLLINVYEQRFRRYSPAGDIIISHITPINAGILENVVRKIRDVKAESGYKQVLIDGLRDIVSESLQHVDKADTVNILNWGLQQKYLEIEKTSVCDYGPVIPMMFESLAGTPYYKEVASLLTSGHFRKSA
jgi:NADP-dependent 3-hydroxy acid dehydrogenase YdfG